MPVETATSMIPIIYFLFQTIFKFMFPTDDVDDEDDKLP